VETSNLGQHLQIRIEPHQSVISNACSSSSASIQIGSGKQPPQANDDGQVDGDGLEAVRISDGDSGSIASESGSDDGIVSN
jgi:hypothetical protein